MGKMVRKILYNLIILFLLVGCGNVTLDVGAKVLPSIGNPKSSSNDEPALIADADTGVLIRQAVGGQSETTTTPPPVVTYLGISN